MRLTALTLETDILSSNPDSTVQIPIFIIIPIKLEFPLMLVPAPLGCPLARAIELDKICWDSQVLYNIPDGKYVLSIMLGGSQDYSQVQ